MAMRQKLGEGRSKSTWCIGGRPCYHIQRSHLDNGNSHQKYRNFRDLKRKYEHQKDSGSTKILQVEGEVVPITAQKYDGERTGWPVWLLHGETYLTVSIRYGLWRRGVRESCWKQTPLGDLFLSHSSSNPDQEMIEERHGATYLSGNESLGRNSIILKCFILMNYHYEKVSGIYDIAHMVRGCGHGWRGLASQKDKQLSTSRPCRGIKIIKHLIIEVTEAYHEGNDEGIQKLLEEWEDEVKQGSEKK